MTDFTAFQEGLYAAGERHLPYYYRRYPSLNGSELDTALFPGATYDQYSELSVPGYRYEGL